MSPSVRDALGTGLSRDYGVPAYGTWGSKGSNVEPIEWGEAADDLQNEQAEGVLAAVGRL